MGQEQARSRGRSGPGAGGTTISRWVGLSQDPAGWLLWRKLEPTRPFTARSVLQTSPASAPDPDPDPNCYSHRRATKPSSNPQLLTFMPSGPLAPAAPPAAR
mgnify:CR=1 FL=1